MTGTPMTLGRYTIYGEIAAGGMATIHIGRVTGETDPTRLVAIKRLHAHFANDSEFVAMILDEAWLASRIRHPNVVRTLEIVSEGGELAVVMDYVPGETLSRLWRLLRQTGTATPLAINASILCGLLNGLHAAHEARDDNGQPLTIVHRDVSPQNVMVGADGVTRVLDFGVAKAAVRLQTTRDGQFKGKLAYMAPEQFERREVSRAADIYSASVVAWEALTGRRMFDAATEGELLARVLGGCTEPPSSVTGVDPALDALIMRGLARDPKQRFTTAREMALAVERTVEVARTSQVAEWIGNVAAVQFTKRRSQITAFLAGDPTGGAGGGAARPPREQSSVRTAPAPSTNEVSAVSSSFYTPSTNPSQLPPPRLPSAAPASAARKSGMPGTSGKRRVLIIDDSEVVLSEMRRALEAAGFEVVTTTRAVGNAKYLMTTDLAIIDFHMPGIDGGEVIASLRAAGSSSQHTCRFYLYTQDPAVAPRYAELGFDGVFTEKGDHRALVRQVSSAFRIFEMRSLKRG